MRLSHMLAIFALTTSLLRAQELPAEAQKLIATYDAEVAKMRADVEKLVDKKSIDLALKLAKVQDTATKKGDLDGALAIKAKVAVLMPKEGEAALAPLGVTPKANKAPTRDDTSGGRYVVLYNEFDYTGEKVKVPVPTEISQVMTLGFPNDALRSIQVPAGVIVKLYDADMGGGAETTITESISDLTSLTKIGTTSLSAKKALK